MHAFPWLMIFPFYLIPLFSLFRGFCQLTRDCSSCVMACRSVSLRSASLSSSKDSSEDGWL